MVARNKTVSLLGEVHLPPVIKVKKTQGRQRNKCWSGLFKYLSNLHPMSNLLYLPNPLYHRDVNPFSCFLCQSIRIARLFKTKLFIRLWRMRLQLKWGAQTKIMLCPKVKIARIIWQSYNVYPYTLQGDRLMCQTRVKSVPGGQGIKRPDEFGAFESLLKKINFDNLVKVGFAPLVFCRVC
jgi:hypothetical protein